MSTTMSALVVADDVDCIDIDVPPGVGVTIKLVVLDPECSHCCELQAAFETMPAELKQNNVFVYTLKDGERDQMHFAVEGDCKFPHCFEYVINPAWVEPFMRSPPAARPPRRPTKPQRTRVVPVTTANGAYANPESFPTHEAAKMHTKKIAQMVSNLQKENAQLKATAAQHETDKAAWKKDHATAAATHQTRAHGLEQQLRELKELLEDPNGLEQILEKAVGAAGADEEEAEAADDDEEDDDLLDY